MIPFIIDTTAPKQDGILASFDSPGQGITNDFVFRDIQLAFYHRPVIPNGLGLWQDDWLDTDTFQVTVGDTDAQPTSGTFPIGVLAGTITANTNANPTIITTSAAHNLATNDFVLIFGSNSTPSIDGLYQVTVSDGTHFSIPVSVSVAGTAGSVYDATGLSALPHNEDPVAFQTALNTILTKHSLPSVAVNLLSSGEYNLEATTNGVLPSLYSPTTNALIPQSGVAITVIATGSASSDGQQVVTLYQGPVAYATPSTPLPAAALAVSIAQAGSGTQNKVYAIALTAGTYGGTMSISVTTLTPSAGTFGVIVSGGISASDLQTALVQATNLANTDFNVTRENDIINVEFAGTQGVSNVPVLAATNINLVAPLGVSGFINFNTFALFTSFAATTADELTYTLSIRRTRATGEQSEYFIVPVTLKRNLVQGVALIPVPMDAYFTQAQSDARYLRSNANSHLLSGSTLTVDSGATLALSGSLSGTPTGGTFNLSALTITLGDFASGKITITKTTEQARFRYDTSNYFTVTVASNGRTTFDQDGSSPFAWRWQNGTSDSSMEFDMDSSNNGILIIGRGTNSGYGVSTSGNRSATIGRFCLNGTPGSGNDVAVGDGGSDNTIALMAGTAGIVLKCDANGITALSGFTLRITSGTNKKAGTFTLVAGVATVANTSVTANSVILVTLKTLGGTRVGNPDIVPTAGTGFVATGAIGDTSVYNFTIMEVA